VSEKPICPIISKTTSQSKKWQSERPRTPLSTGPKELNKVAATNTMKQSLKQELSCANLELHYKPPLPKEKKWN
jgi:hypothetical protein